MLFVVGLGNPGNDYEYTRHNVGFMVLDRLVKDLGLSWEFDKNLNSEFARQKERSLSEWNSVIMLKPLAYMNNSGVVVKKALSKWKIQAERKIDFENSGLDYDNLIVIHDDVDLNFKTIRVSKNSSSAGHNGVQSIIDHLGTKKFLRIRIGIKPLPISNIESRISRTINTPDFVLKPFSHAEQKDLETIITASTQLLSETITQSPKVQTIHVL